MVQDGASAMPRPAAGKAQGAFLATKALECKNCSKLALLVILWYTALMIQTLPDFLNFSPSACRIYAPVGVGRRPMFSLNLFSFTALPPVVGNSNSRRIEVSLLTSIFIISSGFSGNSSIRVLVNGLKSGVS